MAQDDMHVLIYKALAYLYDCMKRGKEPDKAMLSCTGFLFGGIPERYWTSVWIQMLVKGVSIAHHDDEVHVVIINPAITLDGVEFMQENTMMRKALKVLQDAKSALPFI